MSPLEQIANSLHFMDLMLHFLFVGPLCPEGCWKWFWRYWCLDHSRPERLQPIWRAEERHSDPRVHRDGQHRRCTSATRATPSLHTFGATTADILLWFSGVYCGFVFIRNQEQSHTYINWLYRLFLVLSFAHLTGITGTFMSFANLLLL